MARFNSAAQKPTRTSGTATISRTADTRTDQGGLGHTYTAKTELFLLAVSNMVGHNTPYEKFTDRDERFERLVRQIAVEDADWFAKFIVWLRGEGNMRSASLVGAAEAVHARLMAGRTGGNRQLISGPLQRADEPGEMLAYWELKYGEPLDGGQRRAKLPMPVKRGLSDAVNRLYNEYSALKYDTAGKGKRFGDVIELAHAQAHTEKQHELYRWLIDRRHGRDNGDYPSLDMLDHRRALEQVPQEHRRALLTGSAKVGQFGDDIRSEFKAAGVTWEWLASWLGGKLDAAFWEAVIPSMGVMALIRNLRNFDEAGVSDKVAQQVIAKLIDPEQIRRSRQFPMRFLSAHRAAPSLRWSYPLEQAIQHSMANIEMLPGNTLILVDTSTSMNSGFSKDGTLMRWDAAALFGIALGQRCEVADLVSFSSSARYWGEPHGANTRVYPLRAGESLLKGVERWKSGGFFLGGGTDTVGAIKKHLKAAHTRVVILTDEEAGNFGGGSVEQAIPASTPLYTWNLAGYAQGHASSGTNKRYTFGGLTDAGFRMIPLLEKGARGAWPWETRQTAE